MYCVVINGGAVLVSPDQSSPCVPHATLPTAVLLSVEEYQTAMANPFVMSTADAIAISGPMLLLWGSAWGIRTLIRVLRDSDSFSSVDQI